MEFFFMLFKISQCFQGTYYLVFMAEEGKQRFACCLLLAGILPGLLFSHENRGNIFLQNVS
jgi:hypothetical protein